MLVRVGTIGVVFLVVRLFPVDYPASAYDVVNHLVGFYFAFVGLLVLALVAANGGRDRGQELVAALPSGGRSRVLGWVVLLAGAALLEYALVLVLRSSGTEPACSALLPDSWDLAQGPLMLLGGVLLGLLAARLLPSWAATPVCVVVAVAWVGVASGSFAWHNAYLLGLCGRDPRPPARRRDAAGGSGRAGVGRPARRPDRAEPCGLPAVRHGRALLLVALLLSAWGLSCLAARDHDIAWQALNLQSAGTGLVVVVVVGWWARDRGGEPLLALPVPVLLLTVAAAMSRLPESLSLLAGRPGEQARWLVLLAACLLLVVRLDRDPALP